MDENKLRFGVGVLVIAAIGIGIILAFLFGAFPTVLNREYTLLVEFPSAEGISTNTPVLRDGVRIGRVADIDLLEEQGVLLTLAMDEKEKLTHRYIPSVGRGSLVTGDAKLEFVRVDNSELIRIHGDPNLDPISFAATPYGDGDYYQYGQKADDPLSAIFDLESDLRGTMQSIQGAASSIEEAGVGVNDLAKQVSQVIDGTDTTIEDIADEAVQALEEFQGAMRDVRAIVGNPETQQSLQDALSKLPDLLQNAQETLQSADRTFDSFERVGDRLERVGEQAEVVVRNVDSTVDTVRDTVQGAKRTVDNIERFTQPLGDRSEELVAQVLQTMARLDGALLEVQQFGVTLNNSNGTVKRLLEDEDLYFQIRRTVQNIEEASAKIRPILDDVRVFSDKVARDPRELGVRGALNKRPSGMGFK
tara:strand:+ start:616630 stop:617886 length:1257 start_codon:yes stop_codon:yes gene_type:complete